MFSNVNRSEKRHTQEVRIGTETVRPSLKMCKPRWTKLCKKAANLLLPLCAYVIAAPATGAETAFPDKPITLVAPFSAGSGPDTLVRELARGMTTASGQTVVVRNAPGASSTIATNAVVKAPADGYTILVTGNVAITGNPHMFKELSYDPSTDLAPITAVARGPMVLYANTERVAATSIEELIEEANQRPHPLQYGFTSITTRLPGELLQEKGGIELEGIAYQSGAQALPDLLGGRLDMLFTDFAPWPHVEEGTIRALAVTDSQRSARVPDLPTMQEGGLDDVQIAFWLAAYAPAGTPPEIIDRLNTLFAKASDNPGVAIAHGVFGTEEFLTSPEELATFQAAEAEEWGKVIRGAGIEPQ